MSYVTFEIRQERIGLITLNRPEVLNVINSQVLADLNQVIGEAQKARVGCLIVTGAGGKAFAAGADIGEMVSMTREEAESYSRMAGAVFAKLEAFPAPVIAAVGGYALGGGCELALACDLRIASEGAVFALPEVGFGIIPGWGGMQRLVRAVGLSQAKKMVFTGERIKAGEAKEMGLVTNLASSLELLPECEKLALAMIKYPPFALRAAKEAIHQGISKGLADAAQMESGYFGSCFEREEQVGRMNAFLQKQKA